MSLKIHTKGTFTFWFKNPDCLHHLRKKYPRAGSVFQSLFNGRDFSAEDTNQICIHLQNCGMYIPRDYSLVKKT